MPHIHPVTPAEANGAVSDLYEEMTAVRGSVPNLFQLLGYSPKMLGPAIALANFAGSNDSRVPAKYKQLAYLAASRLNYCDYCLERHAVAGAKAGLTPEQVEIILDPQQPDLLGNPAFDAKEQLIIEYSLELTINVEPEAATVAALKEIFDDEEYLELTFVIATANLFNRLAEGLAVQLEPEYIRETKS
jgi:AhpD family alkylhydroperoxidase